MIKIREITIENYPLICELTTNNNGIPTLYETFVCCNALSLAESKYEKGMKPKAIYLNDKLIGFFMYQSLANNKIMIYRFMIDYKFQQKGLGKKSFATIIEYFRNSNDIILAIDPENEVAKKLYESFGFKFTGKIIQEEHYYRLKQEK